MGVAILNGWPANSGAASFSEIRRASEGDFARNAAGVVRAGILPSHTDPIVTARATMGVNVADFRAVLNRDGAIRIANVGTKVVPLAAAPAANRRIDMLVATQFDPAAPLSDAAPSDGNWAFLEVVQGTASATPVKPALPSRLNGALELATIEVPAGATTTQSAGVIITQTAPYTAMSGGIVVVRSTAELATWTPTDGARAFVAATGGDYVRQAGQWVSVPLLGFTGVVTGAAQIGARLLVQTGQFVVTTDSAGNGTIVFPTPFPNAFLSLSAIDADPPAAGHRTFGLYLSSVNTTLAQARISVRTAAGVAAASVTVRVNWTAFGC